MSPISFQLEIYRQFGVSLQIYYIQSMLIEILDFMRVIKYIQFKFTIFLQNVFVGIHIHTQVHIIHIYPFSFLKMYEKAKVVRLETWTRLNVTGPEGFDQLSYDPNAELEWR
jgi:hypothetical protein